MAVEIGTALSQYWDSITTTHAERYIETSNCVYIRSKYQAMVRKYARFLFSVVQQTVASTSLQPRMRSSTKPLLFAD